MKLLFIFCLTVMLSGCTSLFGPSKAELDARLEKNKTDWVRQDEAYAKLTPEEKKEREQKAAEQAAKQPRKVTCTTKNFYLGNWSGESKTECQ